MTNIKYLQRFFIALFVGFSMCSIQACSDDDDDDDNGGGGSTGTLSTNVGEIVQGSGKKLLSVGEYKFYYTSDGKIKYATEWSSYHEFSSNQVISHYGEEDIETISFSFNGNGFISKMQESGSYEDENEKDTYSSTSDLTYDGEGHLTRITGKNFEEYTYDGETERTEGTLTINLTWDNGLLTKYEYAGSDDDGWTYRESATFDYGDRVYENRHKQYATFVDYLLGDAASICAYIGLFGAGPDYLPVKMNLVCVEEWEDEEYTDNYNYNYSYTYEFNEDGTIRRANSDDFTYGTIEEQGEFSPNESEYQAKATRAGQIQRKHALFGNRLKSRN